LDVLNKPITAEDRQGQIAKSKSEADSFAEAIAAMQTGLQGLLKQQSSQFAEMQKAQEQRMMALQEQMVKAQADSDARLAQTQAAMAGRQTVAGVKTATGSSGTDMQIARRGVSGSFGRGGMRIKSLNV